MVSFRRLIGAARVGARLYRRYRRPVRRAVRRLRIRKTRFGTRGRSSTVYTRRSISRRPTVRRLSRMVHKLRNVVDVDTSFGEFSDGFNMAMPSTVVVAGTDVNSIAVNFKDLSEETASLHSNGNRYKLKTYNERILFSPNSVSGTAAIAPDNSMRRRVRVLYVLAKDEEITGLSNIFNL